MKDSRAKLEWQRLDLQLDSELEATFPASDALKITRRQPDGFENRRVAENQKQSVPKLRLLRDY